MTQTLSDRVVGVLGTGDATAKAQAARAAVADWRSGVIPEIGRAALRDRPKRPMKPDLLMPRDMPRRGKAQTEAGRIALLHAVAHIELNAVDLAADILVRFPEANAPLEFYNDWLGVLDDEAKHFLLLSDRLAAMGAAYGDLPAHDGLWQAAQDTADDLLARLAVVPLVLEARGLDVTPQMIASLEKAGDADSVAVLRVIYRDEIGHVAVGRKWFEHFCEDAPEETWRRLVKQYFRGAVKPPFNDAARAEAGFGAGYYHHDDS
ncbi:MAG: ferritin-like domain-containing protein [Alphaproteobacteria bacterium]